MSGDRYRLQIIDDPNHLMPYLKDHSETIDCLIVRRDARILPLFNQLYEQGTLLPLIILEGESNPLDHSSKVGPPTFLYHSAEVRHQVDPLEDIQATIDRAITKFLHLGPSCFLGDRSFSSQGEMISENDQGFLSENSGIIQVTAERWRKAQTAELKHWMQLGLRVSDDRNYDHLLGFDKYKSIAKRSFSRATP